jgi:hypothetical protein
MFPDHGRRRTFDKRGVAEFRFRDAQIALEFCDFFVETIAFTRSVRFFAQKEKLAEFCRGHGRA